ncbi:helix-turn-helix domain-containing protein [Vibrio aphrogenes]|uniref:helix-turn-helix domain-containing protein n=1 Tax=Vibrio aphrogenes TaxID=1891186 RepID=UPI000B353239|nr:helix-turn-helix domain-containing protein [Vibrio aphrogenes]
MSKYIRELKLCIAQRCLDGESSTSLAKELSIPANQIRYWTSVYRIHGSSSFLPLDYENSADFKFSVLKSMWENNWSISQASAEFNFSSNGTISVWLKLYNQSGFQGLHSRPKGRPSMKTQSNKRPTKPDEDMSLDELREELAYLRAENAVLKKLEELDKLKRQAAKKKR